MSKPAFSLRLKLTLALLLLALCPLIVTMLIVVQVSIERLRENVKEYSLAVSDQVMLSVRAVLAEAGNDLFAIGIALAETGRPYEERVSMARSRLLSGRLIRQISLYDQQGQLVETLRDARAAEGIPRPPQLGHEQRQAALQHDLAPQPLQFSAAGRPFLPLVATIRREPGNQLYAYLWTALDLAPINDELGQLSQRRFEDPARIFLIDSAQRIIAHGKPERVGRPIGARNFVKDFDPYGDALKLGAAYTAEYEVDQEELLGVLVSFPDLGWGVVVEEAREKAYRNIRETVSRATLAGAVFALVALVLGLFMGHRLARPILAVASAARQVAGGAFETRVAVRSRDEVGQMAGAFNTMAHDLEQYQARVIEETRTRTVLSRYLSPEVVERIVARRLDLKLGGERREITVLFADVVAFTGLTQVHPPEKVVEILNELFTLLTEIIFRHQGIVDKFLGDCVMAVFGAPGDLPDHALAATRAAEEMLRWLETGNAKWRRDLGFELQLGIGIGTGSVVAGNLGSHRRMEYTVIGDCVNLAARLEYLARPGQILLSQATVERIGQEFECHSLGEHQVGGRLAPVEIFELIV